MITAIIQAKMNSDRLPGKVLMEVEGRPLLEYLIERVRMSALIRQIVIVTTEDPLDRCIVHWCKKNKVSVFQGSETNVLENYYRVAKKYGASTIVRMLSDCPLMDPVVVDDVIQFYLDSSGVDFVANAVPLPSTYPEGMGVEVFNASALERMDRKIPLSWEEEYVSGVVLNSRQFRTVKVDLEKDFSKYRFNVVCREDFENVARILQLLYPKREDFSMLDLIEFVEKNNVCGVNRECL